MVLTPCGIMQAKRMALRAMNEIPPITKLITSTMVRAKQTAAIIHKKYSNVPLEEDECLREGYPDKTHNMKRFGRVFVKYCVPAGQSPVTNIIVCHSNIIRFLFYKALGIEVGKWRESTLPHCIVTGITIRPSYAMHINFVRSCTDLYDVALYFQ
jgi:serine/threonine-protein phosphatase PGAM5